MSEFNVQTATREELEVMAKQLEVSYAHNIGDEKLREKVAEVLGTVLDEPGATQGEANSESTPAVEEKRVTIRIHESENDKRPVQVALNGKQYVIKRGADVSVPRGVVEILTHSIEQKRDEDGSWTSHPAYPFQILGGAE